MIWPSVNELIFNIFTNILDVKKNCLTFAVQYRGMEQLAARRAHNPKVTGSSPVPATQGGQLTSFFYFWRFGIELERRWGEADG
jgi:hypothetical protein